MDKTIKISKESLEHFNHDKNVVGATNRVPAPITNGADLQSDALCDNLFDEAEYVEQYNSDYGHQVLGFIAWLPIKAVYYLNDNYMRLVLLLPKASVPDYALRLLKQQIQIRSEDEQVEPEIMFNDFDTLLLQWEIRFYYKPEYVEKYNS